MSFMFSWQEQYPTRSLRLLGRYSSCHSNIKFISSRHRVISSISPLWREQEVHKCIHLKHFRVSGIKISNVVTKETSQRLLRTLWHLRKPQINLVSLWGDSFTDVGYKIGQVETLLGPITLIDIIVHFELLYCQHQRWQPNKNVLFRDTTWLFDNSI